MGSLTTQWYGADPSWMLPFEREAKLRFGPEVTAEIQHRCLLYLHTGLDIPGREQPVPVKVRFEAQPRYETFGLAPQDYPRIFADLGLASPHRMPDDSLCLFYPGDPSERRWTAERGLLALLGLAADHIYFETHWRFTGGYQGGTWLAPEAPHGYQGKT